MWTLSKADGYKYENGTVMQSDPIYDAAKWDKDYATLLDMGGSGRRYNNRMTLHRNSDYADAAFLNHAMSISANYTVGYSANAYYTINAGFVSILFLKLSRHRKLTVLVFSRWCPRDFSMGRYQWHKRQR
jgi:hypothetical protein